MRWKIYTDGACKVQTDKAGGYAAIVVTPKKKEYMICGFEEDSTNNRMELRAVVAGLQHLPAHVSKVEIISDSKYVIDGITKWIKRWVANDWKTAKGKDVLNVDLWMELYNQVHGMGPLSPPRNVTWTWVKGHSGHPLNERVDFVSRKVSQAVTWHPGSNSTSHRKPT